MPDSNLLTEHEAEHARSQGWLLCPVYCLTKKHLRPQILPLEFKAPFATAASTASWVVARARQGDAIALRALRLVMQGHKQ